MPNFKVEIVNHPAQARHPFTKKPLVDGKGKPVPLFPDEFAIELDGKRIGYVGSKEANRPIMLIISKKKLGKVIVDEVTKSVVAKFSNESALQVSSVPENPEKPPTK